MRKLARRLVCLLLAMAMCLSLVGPALAEELSSQDSGAPSVQASESNENTDPSTEKEQPSDEQEKPSEEQNQSSDEQEKPSDEHNSSSDEQEKPSEEQTPSSDEQEKPTEEQNPSSGEQEQTSDVQNQSSGDDANSSGQENHSDGEQTPTDDGNDEEAQAPVVAPVLNRSSLTLKTLESAQLSLTNASAASFVSRDQSIASVNQNGVVTARHVGSTVIVVTDQQGQTVSCQVQILPTTTKSSATLYVGRSTTLTLKDRTLFSAVSSNSDVATVNAKGAVTAHHSGAADITLTDTLGDLHVCSLSVRGVLEVRSVTVSEAKSLQLRITGADIKNASTSNERVVSINARGKLTGVKAGKAYVTLTDNSGAKVTCKVVVKPNYLARTATNATRIYNKIVALRCRHVTGVHTYAQMVKRRHCTCTTGASLSLQAAGVLKKGDWITHTSAGGVRGKLRNPSRAIKNLKKLKKGTYTLYKANCRYSQLPKKYKAAGMVYVQDSNICVSAGNGYIYSCNESANQYRGGHYYRTKVRSGYTHRHNILYVIAPKS